MSKVVFISYNHMERPWVMDRLVPCLRAGGADVLVDLERFSAGESLIGEMDIVQDKADGSVLVLSPTYLQSEYCLHEMHRALERQRHVSGYIVVPIKRVACALPEPLRVLDLLYVDLCRDQEVTPWAMLLQKCEADLGTTAPDWLGAHDDILTFLGRGQSVNLLVSGNPRWRELIDHVRSTYPDLGIVDLDSGLTVPRWGLVEEILAACAVPTRVPQSSEDLRLLTRVLSERPCSRLAIKHFDRIVHRPDFDVNLFAALRELVMVSRKLVLLVQSRALLAALLPSDKTVSPIDHKTVELKGYI